MERGKRNVHKMINRSYPSLSELHITGKLVCTALSAGLLPSRLQHYRPSGYSIGAQSSSTRMWPAIAHNVITRPNIPETDYDPRVFFRRSSTLSQSMVYGMNQDEFMRMFPSNSVQTVRYPVPNRFPRAKAYRDGSTIDELSVSNVTQGQYTIVRFERMNLTNCPSVKYAENCQLLSLQYNRIVKISHLQRMENLIFLDLSNNQLNSICGLNDLVSLRVLLLPKNHIRRIQGLDQLLKLEVLDLHQNHIRRIENLAHLTRLRLLNLASNKIVFVNGLSGMQSLTELNLRHNQIVQIEPMLNLPSLAWIFLSTNKIERWTQISGLAGLSAKAQVTLDGNPIVLDPMYRRIVPTTSTLQSEQTGTRNEQVTPATGGSPFRGKQDPRRGDYEMIMVNTPSFEKMSCSSTKLSPALSEIQSPNGDFYKHDSDRESTSLSEILSQSQLTDTEPYSVPGCTKVGELFSIRMEPEGETRFQEDFTVSTPPPIHSDIRSVKSSDTSVPLFKNVQIMTKNSFLISKSVPQRTQKVKWYIKDRTHLYLTSEPMTADTQSAESIIDLLQNLKTVLTDLANARPSERSIPGGPVPVRGSHLIHITSVTVTGLNWSEFIVELPRIRILLPEMKSMQLIDMGLERLTDILAMVHVKRLDALHVIPGPGNPIVEQAGQFWRPFVIWALRNVLDLNELDKRPITCEDMAEATSLFKSFGQAVLLRTQKSNCGTDDIAPPNPGSEFGLNILPPRRSPALHRLIASRLQESSSVSRYSTTRNSWLDALVRDGDTSSHSMTTQINDGVHEFELDGDSDETNPTFLNADTVKEWISLTTITPISETRRQTVHLYVEKIINSVAHRLVRQTRIMDMWPSILKRLVERELGSPDY